MIVKLSHAQAKAAPVSRRGQPTWEVAYLFPQQGKWTEDDYFELDSRTNRMIELSNGCVEFLPRPDLAHCYITRFLFRLLDAFVVRHKLGEVLFAPLPTRLWPGEIREPDMLFLAPERLHHADRYPKGADLIVEVVSPDPESRKRDLQTKRRAYAKAGIAEYWIIDPKERHIRVLSLKGKAYREHGAFGAGTQATSVLLRGFAVQLDEVFAVGKGK